MKDIVQKIEKLNVNVQAAAKVCIYSKTKLIGPGIVELLKYIKEYKTLQLACKNMGLSYTKGWKIINRLEKGLGIKILVTKIGGATGGESKLTKAAVNIIEIYENIQADVDKALSKSLKKHLIFSK